jgi:hypothetical protein
MIEHIIHQDGREEWLYQGLSHRTDGPAVIYPDGKKEWWINDLPYNEDEFVFYIKFDHDIKDGF